MKKWFEYHVMPGAGTERFVPLNDSFEAQSKAMGGYEATEHYADQDSFEAKYYHGRYVIWKRYIESRIKERENILSIASGRAIVEMMLKKDGFGITCSDLEVPACYQRTTELFGPFDYLKMDITGKPPEAKYRAAICLSAIFLLDREQLHRMFRNVAALLQSGGMFILDSAGSNPTPLCSWYHNVFLRLEARLYRLRLHLSPRSKKKYDLIRKHKGYRWATKELIEFAREHGLILLDQAVFDPVTDLRRSRYLRRITDSPNSLPCRLLVRLLGRRMHHIRMFTFIKNQA